MKKATILILSALIVSGAFMMLPENPEIRLLVFSKTEGYRHASIEPGQEALRRLGRQHGFEVVVTEDAAVFREDNLRQYDAVVFLNTTGDVLDDEQQQRFERYIQAGGGYVGIHAATDTEYEWPWYGQLAGGYFDGHPSGPNVREGVLTVMDADHPATAGLPASWTRTDEWYDFKSFNLNVRVLLTIDERSYRDEVKQSFHPMAWSHEFDGGRAFYTALGHTAESYTEPLFLDHLWGGIRYAVGLDDATGANETGPPDESRFRKIVLDFNLNEPMELDLLDDGRILFVERHGDVKLYDPQKEMTQVIALFDLFSKFEEGLLGVAVDPDYATNRWVYFSYSAPDTAEIRLARFVLDGTTLDFDSEKILLRVPVQREQCCHVAGSLEFGPDGHLFFSIGDNTNPFASDGFGPMDEREGRSPWDAQGTSANTDDLRGKIMRIKPEPDGTYSIPDGNLFPKDGSAGRPEIYVMGNRNPFRLSVDARTGYLYWGEVGPDAGEDGETRGPKGHDEINQARQAGNFGWPLFVGNNKPYRDYDFATETSGDLFDPNAPVNDSPNNTGMRVLPPAQPAFIWYPYGPSPEFPLVGEGGRNAMAGPVFYHDEYEVSNATFPEYYNGKLFIYDWMRDWIKVVTMDENGDFMAMEPFLPDMEFSNPMDMLFGPDGAMYLLEYGSAWNQRNQDARLVRIEYTSSNRPPVIVAGADPVVGAAPLTVAFSANASRDPEGEALTFAWDFEGTGAVQSVEADPVYTFRQPGGYTTRLTVTDADGQRATGEVVILVGNDVPEVEVKITGNRTFFWDNSSFAYNVAVTDTEDGSLDDGGIDPEDVTLAFEYLPKGVTLTLPSQGHRGVKEDPDALLGKTLISGSDCQACHQPAAASIGPSYTAVAQKYKDEADAEAYLVGKIIEGGVGVWGDQAMAAHPQLTEDEAAQMVRYILSLADEAEAVASAPLRGVYTTNEHDAEEGGYVITASYQDRGANGIGPLFGRDVVLLRAPHLQAEAFDATDRATTVTMPDNYPGTKTQGEVVVGTNNAFIAFADIDLTGIDSLSALIGLQNELTTGGRIDVRLGRPNGPRIGTFDIPQPPETITGFNPHTIDLMPTNGVFDLVFVFVNDDNPEATDPVCGLDWIYFHPEDGE